MMQLNIDSYLSAIDAIDSNDIHKIENLIKNSNKNNKNDINDIIIELYNNNFLTVDRLQFIMKYCTKYLNISSNLIKRLVKEENIKLLDIIFNSLKFYDNAFILQLLLHFKNKIAISTSDLNQLISNEKFKISLNTKYSRNIVKYLINECNKKFINIYIIKYLIKNGIDINKENYIKKNPIILYLFQWK